MKEGHIFPFFIKKEQNKLEDNVREIFSKEKAIIRGIEMQKIKLDKKIDLYKDSNKLDCDVFYWKPVLQDDDIIIKGIDLIEKGLGFGNDRRN